MSRETFRAWVKELGSRKVYPNTKYVNLFGTETTVKDELAQLRKDLVKSAGSQPSKVAGMSDPELLNWMRQVSDGAPFMNDGEAKGGDARLQDLISKMPTS